MLYASQSDIRTERVGLMAPLLFLLPLLVVFFVRPSLAGDILTPSMPAEWVSGPATAKLGEIAEIKIPEHYRFTDASGARGMLERRGSRVPEGLLGIVVPEIGSWLLVLEYAETGYVQDKDQNQLDTAAILAKLRAKLEKENGERARRDLAPFTSVDWEMAPAYDPALRGLEWALKVESRGETNISQSLRLLAHNGVLTAVAVRSANQVGQLPLKQLAQGITFQPQQAYADYKPGDKLAAFGLAGVLTADWDEEKPAGSGGMKSVLVTLAIGAACVGLVIALCLVVANKLRQRKTNLQPTQARPQAQAAGNAAPAPTAEKPTVVPAPARAKPAPAAAVVRPKAASARRHVNGSHSRKRIFDYNRYFNDLMSNVSSYTVMPPAEQPGVNGVPHEPETMSTSPGAPASTPVNGASRSPGQAIETSADLIAHQKTLIEDQRRLIQEQTKLIEEKTRLIAEKNQLLKMQSELMDNNLL